jgi:hypothetical protein
MVTTTGSLTLLLGLASVIEPVAVTLAVLASVPEKAPLVVNRQLP